MSRRKMKYSSLKYSSFVALALIFGVLSFVFQNCTMQEIRSKDVTTSPSKQESNSTLSRDESLEADIVLNQGKAFSKSENVMASSSNPEADLVSFSFGSKCSDEWHSIDSTPITFPRREGVQSVRVRVKNSKSELTSDCYVFSLGFDFTPPDVQVLAGPGPKTNATLANFDFTVSETGSGLERIECQLNSSLEYVDCTDGFSATELVDGAQELRFRSIDKAGNDSATKTFQWEIQKNAPTINIVSQPTNFTRELVNSISFTATDSKGNTITAANCKVNGADRACAPNFPLEVTSTQSGAREEVQISVEDDFGNNASAVISWIIDRDGPSIAFVGSPPELTNQKVRLAWSATDGQNGSGVDAVECLYDNSPVECSDFFEESSVVDGVHRLEVRAIDELGNRSDLANFSWRTDATPPTIKLTKTLVQGDEVTQEFEVTDASSFTFVCSSEDATVSCSKKDDSSLSLSISNFESDSAGILVEVTDQVGNKGTFSQTVVKPSPSPTPPPDPAPSPAPPPEPTT